MKLIIIMVLFVFLYAHAGMAVEEKRLIIKDIQSPVGMIYDKQGNLYVAEWSASRVSKFDIQGNRTTVVNTIQSPSGLAFDTKGNFFVASYGDGNIYLVKDNGDLTSIASGFSSPTGLLWTKENTLLVANRNAGEIISIKINDINSISNSNEERSSNFFTGIKKEVISKGHRTPVGIAQTDDGTLYVSCYGGSVDRVQNGSVTLVSNKLNTPGVGIIADGNAVLVVDYGGTSVFRITPDGESVPVANGLHSPVGLTRMPNNDILVGTWADNAGFAFTFTNKKK